MALFGLFGKKQSTQHQPVNSEEIERKMYNNNTMGYRDTKDRLVYQNALLEKVNSARKQYESDNDLNAVIDVFEDAFIKADPPCSSSQNLLLVDYYLKNNENNKAWGYLNLLYSKQQAPAEKIRTLQAKILKQEKKYDQAIEIYITKHIEKASFEKESFLLDIKSCLTKLKIDPNIGEQLAVLIQNQADQKDYDAKKIIDSYRQMRGYN